MLEFIKMFGLGIVYTIFSPLILAFFLLFVVYSVFNYLVLEVVNLGGFFFGRRLSEETELDKLYKKMKREREEKKQHVVESASVEEVSKPVERVKRVEEVRPVEAPRFEDEYVEQTVIYKDDGEGDLNE